MLTVPTLVVCDDEELPASLMSRDAFSFSIIRMAFSRAAAISSLAWIALSMAAIFHTFGERPWLKMFRYQCSSLCHAAYGKHPR
jgi:hypothetical protein